MMRKRWITREGAQRAVFETEVAWGQSKICALFVQLTSMSLLNKATISSAAPPIRGLPCTAHE
eukprot:1228438-Amphidinium_carterae.1